MEDGRGGTDVMVIACILTDPFFWCLCRCDCDLVVKWCALQMSRYIGTNRRTGRTTKSNDYRL